MPRSHNARCNPGSKLQNIKYSHTLLWLPPGERGAPAHWPLPPMWVSALGCLLGFSLNLPLGCFSSSEWLPRLTLGLGGGEGMSQFLQTKALGWVNAAASTLQHPTCWTGSAEWWAGFLPQIYANSDTPACFCAFSGHFLRFYLRF